MSEEFSVADRIRALLDDTDLTEPADIAGKLLADMNRDERAAAFEQVAEMVVSVYLTRDRMSRGNGTTQETPAPSAAEARPGRPARTKAQRVAQWWRAELRKRYRGVEGWLMLGEFSIDDHTFAANERRQRAAAIVVNADWHERCAEAMRTAQIERFDDLPADVLADLLTSRRPE